MTSPATLESSSPMEIDVPELEVEEAMLKRKAAILEEFLRNAGQETTAIEDRCRILRRKIDLLEDEMSIAGKSYALSHYLEHPPLSHFVSVTRNQFSEWLRYQTTAPAAATQEINMPTRTTHRLPNILPTPTIPWSHTEKTRSTENPASSPSKRTRTDANEKPPCLRCKILKKRCDSFETCAHCPVQSYENTGDYWKVLGCFRKPLRDLSSVFCPNYSRSTQRTITYRQGGIDVINFVLTKSRVSEQKKRRMLYLVQTSDEFSELRSSVWENFDERLSLSRKAISLDEYGGDDEFWEKANLEDYEAAWSVLQAVSMDLTYVKPTTYNLFTLLALGNTFKKQQPAPWEIFTKAKQLLRQSVELYLLERLCGQIAAGEMASPPFDPLRETPNTLVLVDLKEDFESFLASFEKMCIGRAKLTGHTQLACFYSLLVLSITKSLLTDAYSLRAGYESASAWQHNDSVRIASAFKALVGVFCWSSQFDVVLQNDPGANPLWTKALKDTRAMVRDNLWSERGIKGSKEFLLNLGSCWYPDGSYNGFFVQRFGLDILTTSSSKAVEVTRPTSRHSQSESTSLAHAVTTSPGSHSKNTSSGTAETLTWISQTQSHSESARFSPPRTSIQTKPLIFVGQDNDDDRSSTGRSRRRGALNAASLVNAREIRKIGACWNCWAMKVPCSEGSACHRCRAKTGSRAYHLCNRGNFEKLFSKLFFPDFLTAQFRIGAINEYISTQTIEILREGMGIAVSWDADRAKSIRIRVYLPSPESEEYAGYNARDGRRLGVESLPVGLTLNSGFTQKDFLQDLESLMETRDNIVCASPRHASPLSTAVLDAVFKFHKSMETNHPAIKQGLLLCSAIHSVTRPLLISDSSSAAILEHLGRSTEDDKLYSSRLLNRQMKSIMFETCQHLISDFLVELEKLFKRRQRSLWPICFAAMLLLCMVIEQVQNLAYAHAQVVKSSEPESVGLENEPRESCHGLDESVYGQLTHIFHATYRTNKGERDGLNPLGEEFKGADELGFDDAAMTMIQEIKAKDLIDVDILEEQDQVLDFNLAPEEFAKQNSGRLLARFLLDFVS